MSGWLADIRGALSLLTVFPVKPSAERSPGGAFAWFPLIGLALGAMLAAVVALPVSAEARAFLALTTWVLLTGGLHLDGWADACDGLLATASPARRLEIMKDPRAGTWAIIGLILLLLGKWVALRALPPLWLIAPPVAGRWATVLAAHWFHRARSSGSAATFGVGLGRTQVIFASLTVLAIAGVLWAAGNERGALSLLCAPLLAFVFGSWASSRLGGGITGDVYGAVCEFTELVCVWSLALWIGV